MLNRYKRYYGFVLIVIVLIVSFLPLLYKNPYYLHVVILIFINIILTVGLNLMFKIGILSFGHAAFACIGGYASGLIAIRMGWPFWLSFISSGIITAIVALFIGYVTLSLRGIYLTITTFSFGEVLRGIINAFPDELGGPGGVGNIPALGGSDSILVHYYIILLIMLINFFVFYRIIRIKFGLICDGIRENEVLAECFCIDIRKMRLCVFVLGCTSAGMGGSILVHYLGRMNPETFSVSMSIDLIVFCVVGGFGSLFGSVFSAAFLTYISMLLFNFGAYKNILFGIILVGSVLVIPGAINGLKSVFVNLTINKRNIIV